MKTLSLCLPPLLACAACYSLDDADLDLTLMQDSLHQDRIFSSAAIEEWGRGLEQAGIVDELIFLPGLLMAAGAEGPGPLQRARAAAVRSGADAVLPVHSISRSTSEFRASAVLDLTLVGMFVNPGHKVRCRTLVEGVIVDAHNEFLYVAGQSDSLAERGSTAVDQERHARELTASTRMEALDGLAEELWRASLPPLDPVLGADPGLTP